MATNTSSSTPRGELIAAMRERIVKGEFRPGSRLPSRVQMRETFNSTAATIQRVFDQLERDGFVVAQGRSGTYVSETPPHLCHYGLVFDHQDTPEHRWPIFWRALRDEAEHFESSANNGGVRFSVFYAPRDVASIASHEQLQRHAAHDCLAGLIFAPAAYPAMGLPDGTDLALPMIVVSQQPMKGAATLQMKGFLARALDHARERGRRRIAVIVSPALVESKAFVNEVQCRGMATHPWWQQAVFPAHSARWIEHTVRLLCHGERDERPDTLIIADDNAVAAATQTIRELDIAVPDELQVIAHANFPCVSPSHVPATRIGYSARQLLRRAVDYISAVRRSNCRAL